jgi:hypothetical protein
VFVAECRTGILVVFNGGKKIEHLTLKRDEELIQKMVSKGKLFFLTYILPELISKKFSSAKIIENAVSSSTTSAVIHPNLNQFICSCQDQTKSGETVTCSSELCAIKVYHKTCTKSIRFPDNWMCVSCKKETARMKIIQLKLLRANHQSNAISQSETPNVIPSGDGITGKLYKHLFQSSII